MARKGREIVYLVSEASSYFYTTSKNKGASQEKLRLKKYDPVVRRHVWFTEGKR